MNDFEKKLEHKPADQQPKINILAEIEVIRGMCHQMGNNDIEDDLLNRIKKDWEGKVIDDDEAFRKAWAVYNNKIQR